MGFSRVFVLLSITLCLVACLCAHAAVSRAVAQKAVTDLKKLTTKTLEKAQQRYKDAESARKSVESRKAKAENAASEAEATASGNEEAKPFVEKAKSELQECLKLHPNAKESAEKAVPAMQELMKRARKLDSEAEINVEPDKHSKDDYTQVTESVKAVEAKIKALEKDIETAKPLLEAASAALFTLSAHADKAEVAKDQVKAVVTVAKINTLLDDADADIASIKQKRDKVDATVKEISEILKTAPEELIPKIAGLSNKAESHLRQISRSVSEVQEDKNVMVGHKKSADDVLADIKRERDDSNVRQHLRTIVFFAEEAEKSLAKIKNALKSAETHVKSANYRKDDALELISPKSGKPTGEGTTAPKHKKPEETEKDRKTKPTNEGTTATNGKKPVQTEKDGEKKLSEKWGLSKVGGENDSAITVSFSLLVALIACAGLY